MRYSSVSRPDFLDNDVIASISILLVDSFGFTKNIPKEGRSYRDFLLAVGFINADVIA